MSRLNPVYILALMITVFIISVITIDSKKEEYTYIDNQHISLTQKVKDYKEYKRSWFNKQRVIKKLGSILKSRTFRGEKIGKTLNDNSISVKLESDDPKILNRFLNRVLNEKFIFRKFNMNKNSISFEIGLQE